MRPWLPLVPETPAVPGRVLVVGAGGLGCPALWGLAAEGVRRVRIVDPDVVERSNLPRQVLFEEHDLDQPKARVAAARVASCIDGRHEVEGRARALDETTADSLLQDIDVVIDATDGARTKDWVHREAVLRGLPLVHAAALRSEGRLLAVPGAGKPCLACLFGRLEEDAGRCADLGVWNAAVGTTGFLAAHLAAACLRGVTVPARYHVLDYAGGTSMPLEVRVDAQCPVCSEAASRSDEPLPPGEACAVSEFGTEVPEDVARTLDLRLTRCPMNLLEARAALDGVDGGAIVRLRLGSEGRATVPQGIRDDGHEAIHARVDGDGLDLYVRARTQDRSAVAPHVLDATARERFARQIVLPEFGTRGQARLGGARLRLRGRGLAAASAHRYLAAAGVGEVQREDADGSLEVTDPNTQQTWRAWHEAPGTLHVASGDAGAATNELAGPSLALALGSLLADTVQRALLDVGRGAARLSV